MSRTALKIVIGIALLAGARLTHAVDPHMDPTLMPTGCPACHAGHGEPRSPMLPAPQAQVCLSCHGYPGDQSRAVLRGDLSPSTPTRSLSTVLSQPFVHPITERAYSRHEPGVVTCTSCHSPHRGMTRILEESAAPQDDTRQVFSFRRMLRSGTLRQEAAPAASVRKRSPRDPDQTEFQLCAECHGGTGPSAGSPLEISQLASTRSRSYHPLQAPATETAPSVYPELAGREVNCTDCHGNSDPSAIRGPHGSNVRFILRAEYQTVDGSRESAEIYALCYECHDREMVLDSVLFPEHRLHVVDEMASCATCHDPHGSAEHRSLIRFGQETVTAGVLPSTEANRLDFESAGPGVGACYLTCHGFDHSPEGYGGALPGQRELDSAPWSPGDFERVAPRSDRPGRRSPRR